MAKGKKKAETVFLVCEETGDHNYTLKRKPGGEKLKLMKKEYESFYELKLKIQYTLSEKMKKMSTQEDPDVLSLTQTSDAHILKIATLGKHALKDRALLTTLWHTLKNQNKIATLLKVNRSSVSRRCKEYNLL